MPQLVAGTRLHLGNAAAPPPDSVWSSKIESFARFCTESCGSISMPTIRNGGNDGFVNVQGVIAVDATPRFPTYNLVDTIQRLASSSTSTADLQILPVTPWGKCVPALNALVAHAARTTTATFSSSSPFSEDADDFILFVSAETSAPSSAVRSLLSHMDYDTLVAGARLDGHDYRGGGGSHPTTMPEEEKQDMKQHQEEESVADVVVPLDGRTSPWNTLAVWNLKKLALTGFQLVSDGLLTDDQADPSYGIEEVVATCLLQCLLGEDWAKAKLVHLPDIRWDQQFDDPERKKWHEFKMNSKLDRAARQLELTGLSGVVHHC